MIDFMLCLLINVSWHITSWKWMLSHSNNSHSVSHTLLASMPAVYSVLVGWQAVDLDPGCSCSRPVRNRKLILTAVNSCPCCAIHTPSHKITLACVNVTFVNTIAVPVHHWNAVTITTGKCFIVLSMSAGKNKVILCQLVLKIGCS